MKRKHVQRNKSSNFVAGLPRNDFIAKISMRLRYSVDPRIEVFAIKRDLDPLDIFSIFPQIFKTPKILNAVHGPAFPEDFTQLFSVRPYVEPQSLPSEIVWSICRCLQYSSEIRQHVELERALECSILTDDKKLAEQILQSAKSNLGVSTWLFQSELAVAQHWDGFDGVANVESMYETLLQNNPLIQLIFWFVKKRIESTSTKEYLEGELQRVVAGYSNEILQIYLSCKIFNQYEAPLDSMASLLFYESQNGIVDLYEALIAILQTLVTHSAFVNPALSKLVGPITTLFEKVGDSRLHGVLRVLGRSDLVPEDIPGREMAIEAYSAGDYVKCIECADVLLKLVPDDMHVLTTKIKAMSKLSLSASASTEVIDDISNNLLEILVQTGKTYTAANYLFALAGKFYGMSWVNYIKTFVMYKLQPEREEGYSIWMRELLLRDPYSSPFTQTIETQRDADALKRYAKMLVSYPATSLLFRALMLGDPNNPALVNEFHYKKNLARHYLSESMFAEALVEYKWLVENAPVTVKLRYAGGLTLAYIGANNLFLALETLVSAFFENSNAPSVLPIKELIEALGEPDSWPNSILTPLIFEIYLQFYNADRIADLRYAFEKFHEDNGIETAEDFVAFQAGHPLPLTIAYLERVWRPEVMRQTLLYSGIKEIEEARVKVCQKLVEINPLKAKSYLDEIKERIKQLEIAKGMTLVEKSKVYVDIDAIKKALRLKLGDTYAKYKALSPTMPTGREDFIEKLTSAFRDNQKTSDVSLSSLLSGLYLFDGAKVTEADSQFDSLFSEVTNEFLKGAHGLNSYLSTRVRHGTLSSTLRKAVEDERLVTAKEQGSNAYMPNIFWMAVSLSGETKHVNDGINAALSDFATTFDTILDFIKDELLQIRIARQINEAGDVGRALFVYRSSNLERKLAQVEDRALKDIDQFVDRCVDTLWEKTDGNLAVVQSVLRGEIRDKFQGAFDQLTSTLANFPAVPVVNDLSNAVRRARTNTLTRLDLVASWFKRSEVYDRQDFSVDFPIHIAINMIKNTMSIASDWGGIAISVAPHSDPMPGRTLDGLVYVFYGLIENAINHSKLPVGELLAKTEISYVNGSYSAKFYNKVNLSKICDEDNARVAQIRESILLKESPKKAQEEIFSGLHKIWLTVSGPFHREPKLEFDWCDDSFVVALDFRLDWS
ncbi:hypothetical protein [Pseudomonas fluorescens]|uniref:Uncharacterized protein n=1 Tax=Pseudomonas fluorescens TaxID=294 RepID=A0A5E7UJG2_PSEFL|nr:hypothetical protein [Pseudomonas fluorescens]VVQ11582.1 hypothetical protein PS922_04860 [Pseudomonas fluorescens]